MELNQELTEHLENSPELLSLLYDLDLLPEQVDRGTLNARRLHIIILRDRMEKGLEKP